MIFSYLSSKMIQRKFKDLKLPPDTVTAIMKEYGVGSNDVHITSLIDNLSEVMYDQVDDPEREDAVSAGEGADDRMSAFDIYLVLKAIRECMNSRKDLVTVANPGGKTSLLTGREKREKAVLNKVETMEMFSLVQGLNSEGEFEEILEDLFVKIGSEQPSDMKSINVKLSKICETGNLEVIEDIWPIMYKGIMSPCFQSKRDGSTECSSFSVYMKQIELIADLKAVPEAQEMKLLGCTLFANTQASALRVVLCRVMSLWSDRKISLEKAIKYREIFVTATCTKLTLPGSYDLKSEESGQEFFAEMQEFCREHLKHEQSKSIMKCLSSGTACKTAKYSYVDNLMYTARKMLDDGVRSVLVDEIVLKVGSVLKSRGTFTLASPKNKSAEIAQPGRKIKRTDAENKNDKALKTPHGVVRAVATVKEKVVFSELKLAAKTERKSGGSKQKEGNTWYILDSPFMVVIDFL